jgi:hypothetical protein
MPQELLHGGERHATGGDGVAEVDRANCIQRFDHEEEFL